MNITSEEAIKILDRRTTIPDDIYSWEDINEAIEMAIKAIKMKDKIEAALLEILEDVEPECIKDSSGDIHGNISHYQRGLYDAAQIILKHVGEDLKQ